jgi:hypothetical protein
MDNYNAKMETIIDLQQRGFDQDFILIKDCLLYVGGNGTINRTDLNSEESPRFKDASRLGENNTAHAVKPPDNNAGSFEHDELTYKRQAPRWKQSFLVFKNPKYTTVPTDNIAFFYIRNNSAALMSFNKQEYVLNQSLDQITSAVSPDQFFRVNRQYLINFKAIKEVELYFMRKLHIKLTVETPEKLLINKEKSSCFLSWMENR